MTIIVEDGTIVSGANSYVSEAEFATFYGARNITLSGDFTAEQLLILAMDYIESLNYIGIKRQYTQGLQWPRTNVVIDGYYQDIDIIPTELKNGLMQTAIAIDQGNNPQQNAPRRTKREKVEGLEVEYADGASAVVIDRKVMGFLRKLLVAGSGGANTIARKG